ncbi:MAG: YHYH protein [Flavobacteriaceae bacterium]|nr:YHYH protein [Flavobacteriaceae bacterium]
MMESNNLLESVTLVNATLTDGTTAECYQLVFKSNPVADGPYCPETINDIGGVGIYDGNTNPGFQVMKAELWNAMEADGYDIVDENGNINIVDPGATTGGPPSVSACLEATADDDLQLTFLIPAVPKLATSNDEISQVEHMGVSRDGIPMTGHPPSATQAGGGIAGIPSIDPCGGHMDPFGYYHLHFGPEEMNNVLAANNMTDVSCTNFTQSETAFIGFAKDGYPIYAAKDEDGTLPSDLDECQGHFGVTADYPDGVYHYHVSNTSAPNLPECLKGVSAVDALTYE